MLSCDVRKDAPQAGDRNIPGWIMPSRASQGRASPAREDCSGGTCRASRASAHRLGRSDRRSASVPSAKAPFCGIIAPSGNGLNTATGICLRRVSLSRYIGEAEHPDPDGTRIPLNREALRGKTGTAWAGGRSLGDAGRHRGGQVRVNAPFRSRDQPTCLMMLMRTPFAAGSA
jgi:hypothetical protein